MAVEANEKITGVPTPQVEGEGAVSTETTVGIPAPQVEGEGGVTANANITGMPTLRGE